MAGCKTDFLCTLVLLCLNWISLFYFDLLLEFGVHLAELTVDRTGALAIRQVSYFIPYIKLHSFNPHEAYLISGLVDADLVGGGTKVLVHFPYIGLLLCCFIACMKGNLRSWVNIDREGGDVRMLLWYMYSNLSFFLTLKNARDMHL